MYVTQKIRIVLSDESEKMLDKYSSLVTTLYNKLLRFTESYLNFNKTKCNVSFAELRNQANIIALDDEELKDLNYCFRTAVAYNINESIKQFNSGLINFPKYKSKTLSWTSLFFTNKVGANNDLIIAGRTVLIKLGKESIINARLKSDINENNKIINYRITKEVNKYYLNISLDRDFKPLPKTNNYIAIDLNNSNLFVAIDNKGIIYQMENLPMIKYFNSKIDEVNRLRGKTKIIKKVNKDGVPYNYYSRRYKKLSLTIQKLERKRNVQIRTALYMIANMLTEKYDVIAIGDYTPKASDAINTTMRRSMVNNSVLATFRTILNHVCNKTGKRLIVVDEFGTTMKCHSCGYIEPKAPDVRVYRCPKCGSSYLRDVNSAINIGIKANLFTPDQFTSINLLKPKFIISYNLFKQKLAYKRISSF